MSRCRDLARLTKEYSNQQIQLRRALEDDPARYLVLWFQFHRQEYEMRALVLWAPRRMTRTTRLLTLCKSELHSIVRTIGADAAAVCFYIDSGNEALLDLVHNEYADLSTINHYHVLHFALHYKEEHTFRRLLEYGYSPLVLDTRLVRIAIERDYTLHFLFHSHWNYKLQRSHDFSLGRLRKGSDPLQPIEIKRLEGALRAYYHHTFGVDPDLLSLAILWKGTERKPMFDSNLIFLIKKYLV